MFLLSLNGNVNEPGFSRLVLKGDRSSFFICFCFGLYWIELRVSMCPFAEGDAPTRLFIFSSLVKSWVSFTKRNCVNDGPVLFRDWSQKWLQVSLWRVTLVTFHVTCNILSLRSSSYVNLPLQTLVTIYISLPFIPTFSSIHKIGYCLNTTKSFNVF